MPDSESELADVTGLNLADRDGWETNAVTESIRAILGELERTAKSISGWSSFIDKDIAEGE